MLLVGVTRRSLHFCLTRLLLGLVKREYTILHSTMAGITGNVGPDILRRLLTSPPADIDPNVNVYGSTAIMRLLRRNYNIDIQRDCLQAMVDSDKVDLDVKDRQGRSLEDLAR